MTNSIKEAFDTDPKFRKEFFLQTGISHHKHYRPVQRRPVMFIKEVPGTHYNMGEYSQD